MILQVNGARHDCQAETLAQLMAQLGYDGPRYATALNGDFVPKGARAATRLNEGDAVEIVAPMSGG